jgi:hypothetical protein
MKTKNFLTLCLVLFLSAASLKAQNVLKINILSPIVRTLNIQYERVLNESSAFQLGFFYTGYSDDVTTWRGFGITPEYRFYLSDSPAPAGVFVAPFLRYQAFDVEDDIGGAAKFSAFGGGLIIGKQWLFKDKITLEVFIGPSYLVGEVKEATSGVEFDSGAFEGFGVRTGITFGFKF